MRKNILRYLALMFVPFIGSLLIRLIYLTSKKKFNLPENLDDENVIFCCWHGDLLMHPYLYYKLRKVQNADVIISDHFDGKIIAKTVVYFKLRTIYGSTNRNASRVLIKAIKTLKNGSDLAITPDGPKGPRREVADGIVVIAKKTKKKIVTLNSIPSSYWQLNSWDKFIIPKPFGELEFFASEPFSVDGLEIEEAKKLVKERLMIHAI
ncbi:MAG: DUF374 domain-containing protein [Helicobacteraceae bacterium]|nr:DUF374 domain-containing protein [Helicobacteraceae bacterium]